MVVIVRNFFDKEHQHVQIALEDCKDLPKVCKEKGLRNACEWIDHSLPVRMYFDIDDKTCSTSLEDWLSSLSRVLHLTCDPISICSSHGTSRNSWHIVYPYKTTLPVCKSLAEKFNRASILKVDASVYKNGQKWRLAGSCKPLSLDPEQRIKIIEKGTFVDTLLGFFNGDEINYKNTDLHLSHPHLIWFQTVLNEPQLEELWRQKSNDYLAWILVGFSIYWECTRDPKSSALELFKIFSAFSPQYKEDETTAKFQGECCKAEKSQFEVIKRWVTTYNKEIADKYSHLYQTKKNHSTTDQAINFIPHAIEDFTITAEAFFQFIPTTVQQFRFYSLLTRSPGLCAYWKKELSDFRNISRLVPLLVIGPSKEINRQTIVNYAIVQKAKEVYGRNVLLPLHSNQLESCKSFIEFLCQYLEVPINTSLLSDSLLEIPKIIDRYADKKNEETFENISIWTKYADIVEFYTPDICHLVNRTISEHYIERLGKEEIQVRYLDRIHSWIRDIEKGTILWQDRIPYLSVWSALLTLPIPKDLLHERIEFFILCYLEFCSADKLFGFLARAFSSHSAAEIVFQFYPHWIIDSNELLVYDYLTGRWTNEESVMLRIIAKYASVLECQMDRGKLNYGESYPKRKEVMNEIICLEKLALSARQHKDLVSSSSKCLLFPNGYYDGNEDRFIPVQTFNIGETLKLKGEHVTFFLSPHIMFFGAIPDPYEETEDLQLQELLKQKYFLDVFDPDVADHILEAIMCALMGIDRKDFYINLGETNSGKSGFKTFMEKSFGTFAGTTGLESLAYNPNEKDSVKFRFVCALSRVRMLFTSEGANITLDTEMIKILVSQGLDVVTARLKGGNEKQFQIHFKLFMYMNNPPVFSIQDNALIGRATYYLYRKSFVKPDDYTDPTSQIIMDETIKNWCHLQSHRQAFVRLCLHAYRKLKARSFELLPAPACLREESPLTAKKVDPPLAYFQKVMYKLRFTGNPNHYISENELKDVLDSIQKGSTVVGTGKIRQILRSLRLEGSIKREKLAVEGDETVIWKGIQTRSCLMNTEKTSPILTGKDYDLWRRYMEEQRGCLSDDFLAELENAHMYLRQSKKRKNDGEPSNLDQLGIALMQKFYLI